MLLRPLEPRMLGFHYGRRSNSSSRKRLSCWICGAFKIFLALVITVCIRPPVVNARLFLTTLHTNRVEWSKSAFRFLTNNNRMSLIERAPFRILPRKTDMHSRMIRVPCFTNHCDCGISIFIAPVGVQALSANASAVAISIRSPDKILEALASIENFWVYVDE